MTQLQRRLRPGGGRHSPRRGAAGTQVRRDIRGANSAGSAPSTMTTRRSRPPPALGKGARPACTWGFIRPPGASGGKNVADGEPSRQHASRPAAGSAPRDDLVAAGRRAVEEDLTEWRRQVFTAIAVKGVPLDALVAQLGSSRNAVYKTMFGARRKLRAALAANGYLTASAEEADLSDRGTGRS